MPKNYAISIGCFILAGVILAEPLLTKDSSDSTRIIPTAYSVETVQPPSLEEIDQYFLDVALGDEMGRASPRIRKWQKSIRIKLNGWYSDQDRQTVQTVITDLSDLIGDKVQLSLVDSDPNIQIYFGQASDLKQDEPSYPLRSEGYTRVFWDNNNIIRDAKILIRTNGLPQEKRNHVIREELTQAMGLLRDSWMHPGSIFFQGPGYPISYTLIDKAVIQLLYQPELSPGMTHDEVVAKLREIQHQRLNPEIQQSGFQPSIPENFDAKPPLNFQPQNLSNSETNSSFPATIAPAPPVQAPRSFSNYSQ